MMSSSDRRLSNAGMALLYSAPAKLCMPDFVTWKSAASG